MEDNKNIFLDEEENNNGLAQTLNEISEKNPILSTLIKNLLILILH